MHGKQCRPVVFRAFERFYVCRGCVPGAGRVPAYGRLSVLQERDGWHLCGNSVSLLFATVTENFILLFYMAEKQKLMVILNVYLETAPHLDAGVGCPLRNYLLPVLVFSSLSVWLASLVVWRTANNLDHPLH